MHFIFYRPSIVRFNVETRFFVTLILLFISLFSGKSQAVTYELIPNDCSVDGWLQVKIGDVNGSAIANQLAQAEDRTFTDELLFNVKDQQLVAGETYEVAFEATNFDAIHGYQFTLNFDETALTFEGVSGGDLAGMSDSNFGLTMLEEGVITTSWTNQKAQRLTRASVVFQVSFTAKQDGLLSEALNVSSRYTNAEAYDSNLELMNVDLRFEAPSFSKDEYRLYQNKPNPFRQETVIGFDLPNDMLATLMIFDDSGRELKTVEGDFEEGYNQVTINREEFLTQGVFYYKLITDSFEDIKRMIIVD